MIPYLIASPPYMNYHCGVKALFMLCEKLRKRGQEAYMLSNGCPSWIDAPSIDRERASALISTGAIVVYPEIYGSNILGAKRPVCWMLNVRDVSIPTIFYYHEWMKGANSENILSFDTIEYQWFNDNHNEKRTINTLWIGKGMQDSQMYRIENMVQITDFKPETREGVAQLLKQSQYFYTYDGLTALIGEALLCGTPVIYLGKTDDKFTGYTKKISAYGIGIGMSEEAREYARTTVKQYQKDHYEYYSKIEKSLDGFIDRTQNM